MSLTTGQTTELPFDSLIKAHFAFSPLCDGQMTDVLVLGQGANMHVMICVCVCVCVGGGDLSEGEVFQATPSHFLSLGRL